MTVLNLNIYSSKEYIMLFYLDPLSEWVFKVSTNSDNSARFHKLLTDWQNGQKGESIHQWNNYDVTVNEQCQTPGYCTYTLRHILDEEDTIKITINGNITGIKITKTLTSVFSILKSIILNGKV